MSETRNIRRLDRLIRLGVLENVQMAEDGISPRSVADKLMDSALEAQTDQVKNVCAKLSVQLSDQIDSTVKWVGISKRRFIEAAIMAALERFDQIAEEEGLDEALQDANSVELETVSHA